jgi:hypothetical protein
MASLFLLKENIGIYSVQSPRINSLFLLIFAKDNREASKSKSIKHQHSTREKNENSAYFFI